MISGLGGIRTLVKNKPLFFKTMCETALNFLTPQNIATVTW